LTFTMAREARGVKGGSGVRIRSTGRRRGDAAR
jgi:hypothetical protein